MIHLEDTAEMAPVPTSLKKVTKPTETGCLQFALETTNESKNRVWQLHVNISCICAISSAGRAFDF